MARRSRKKSKKSASAIPKSATPSDMTTPSTIESPTSSAELHDQSTEMPSPPPRGFLKLPPEIRNQIYDLTGPKYICRRWGIDSLPALSRTCRQVRDETLPMWCDLSVLIILLKWKPKKKQWVHIEPLPSDRVLSSVQSVDLLFHDRSIICSVLQETHGLEATAFLSGCYVGTVQRLARAYIDSQAQPFVLSKQHIAQLASFVTPPTRKTLQRMKRWRLQDLQRSINCNSAPADLRRWILEWSITRLLSNR